MKQEQFRYLGDGVYAMFDGYYVRLRANHHENTDKEVAIEPEVFDQLAAFCKQVWQRA